MPSTKWYLNGEAEGALAGVGVNPIKMAWMQSGYTPNYQTDTTYSSISSHESTGAGYTAGGVTLTTPASTPTAANSWGVSAAVSTAYTVGAIVRPATGNGFLYYCNASGTSGGAAPTWPTVLGATVTDGSVSWTNVGSGIVQLTAAAIPTNTMTCSNFRYAVFYDSVTGLLICCDDTGVTGTTGGVSQTVGYTPDATGIAYKTAA